MALVQNRLIIAEDNDGNCNFGVFDDNGDDNNSFHNKTISFQCFRNNTLSSLKSWMRN